MHTNLNHVQMKYIYYIGFIAIFFNSCIGNDIEQDFVEPEIRITNAAEDPIPKRLSLSKTHSFSAVFFNDIGEKIETPVTWSSSNTNVITIDDIGVATAVGVGESVISASVENDNPNFKGQTIVQEIAVIEVLKIEEGTIVISNPRTTSLSLGDSYNYTADFLGDISVEWSSSDPSVATIQKDTGTVTATSVGTTTITVSAIENGETLTDTTLLNVVGLPGNKATLTGAYGLSGEVTLTSSALNFADNFTVSTAPGGYFYLSNNPNSISAAIKVGDKITSRTGAWSIPLSGISIGDYRYIIFWCDPFNVYLGGGEFQ